MARRYAAKGPSARSTGGGEKPAKAPHAKPGGGRGATATASGGDALARMTTAQLEKEIESLERTIRELDAQLLDPKVYGDARKAKDLGQKREHAAGRLEPLEFEWSRRAGGE